MLRAHVARAALAAAGPARARALHAAPVACSALKTDAQQPAASQAGADPEPPAAASRGIFGSIFYGSERARGEGDISRASHSQIVARGKYVHEKITHAVLPSHRDAYLAAAEKYFGTLAENSPELGNLKITGSWETIIGTVGNFTHILEYDGYAGYDAALMYHRRNPALQEQLNDILPHLESRHHQIISEFSFFPSAPPHDSGFPDGGLFEMRTYQLIPGKLLEWENAWRKGMEARRKFIEPVGAFFAQVGQLHEVHHLWHYPDMATRKKTRDAAWSVGNWPDTVRETVRLTQSMKTNIMIPTPWSPLR